MKLHVFNTRKRENQARFVVNFEMPSHNFSWPHGSTVSRTHYANKRPFIGPVRPSNYNYTAARRVSNIKANRNGNRIRTTINPYAHVKPFWKPVVYTPYSARLPMSTRYLGPLKRKPIVVRDNKFSRARIAYWDKKRNGAASRGNYLRRKHAYKSDY